VFDGDCYFNYLQKSSAEQTMWLCVCVCVVYCSVLFPLRQVDSEIRWRCGQCHVGPHVNWLYNLLGVNENTEWSTGLPKVSQLQILFMLVSAALLE
jgi:hypothetical protein